MEENHGGDQDPPRVAMPVKKKRKEHVYLWSFNLRKCCVCNCIYSQAVLAFVAGNFMAEFVIHRVK
jgi:hypothetical protein